jgi:protein-tyrosine phosphatase
MKILMVCLGNICRSPLADGLLRDKIAKRNLPHLVDSAGTSAHHVGNKPDARMIKTARQFGVDLSTLRARQFVVSDFDEFDLIYVMDKENLQNVSKLARNKQDLSKVSLILNLLDTRDQEVPDPYYGGEAGFQQVYSLLDRATDQLIHTLTTHENR